MQIFKKTKEMQNSGKTFSFKKIVKKNDLELFHFVFLGYPIHTSVVTRHSSHHSYHGVSYYKRYHGFKISHRRFYYHGLGNLM